MKRAVLLLLLMLAGCGQHAQPKVLRVCADPNNLPFSNQAGEGFENGLARLLAHDLGARLEYVWWAQRRGNLRETLKAGRCDLVPGVSSTIEGIATSTPYYRSSYMVVTRPGSGLQSLDTFDDPRLKTLRIGVQLVGDDGVNTPPAHALMHRGLVENVRGFMVQGDYRQKYPQDAILDALTSGKIDMAFVWGPVAGYYAQRHPKAVTIRRVSPAFDGPQLPMVFDVSVGVRKQDTDLLHRVDAVLRARGPEINRLLSGYGVPLLDR